MSSNNTHSADASIVIIGGGIAGATAAVHLSELGYSVKIIEKGESLVSGPPICHLHAGGNLYREISIEQCIELLHQSIEIVRLYPQTINFRPTVIAVPIEDSGEVTSITQRLSVLQHEYASLVEQDDANRVLGSPADYYRCYQREDIEKLAKAEQPVKPSNPDEWMIPFAQHTDLDSIKYPVVLVQEPGWSVFRLAACAQLTLEAHPKCQVLTQAEVIQLSNDSEAWEVTYRDSIGESHCLKATHVINACGYQTGTIDDLAKQSRQRLVEFKAAYVTHWDRCEHIWPEVIFHGERGTPQGMAQLTPYPNGVFQLHGMTKDITLFEEGLASSTDDSSQPKLPSRFEAKMRDGWPVSLIEVRTRKSIEHLSRYLPSYNDAKTYSKPLFGAQQIPGKDDTLRAADVSFSGNRYARIEVVKGSSALQAAMKIAKSWGLYQYSGETIESLHPLCTALPDDLVEKEAVRIAKMRGYPEELAQVFGVPPQ